MKRRLIATALFVAVLVAACGGSSNPSPTSSTVPTRTLASGSASGNSYDMKIYESLNAEWKSGQEDSGMSCALIGNTGVQFFLFGMIDVTRYAMSIRQDTFVSGSFRYPVTSTAGAPSTVPFVQITTNTDSSVDWTANGLGDGSGSVIIDGGGSIPIAIRVDLELQPRGASALHVTGTAQCTPS